MVSVSNSVCSAEQDVKAVPHITSTMHQQIVEIFYTPAYAFLISDEGLN